MLSDEPALIKLAQAGDLKAFEQLYILHVPKVFGLCLRLCNQKELAEDLAQDAFIRAWQKIASFRGDSAFASWLYRLTSNVVIGHLRSQSKWKMVSFDEQTHESALGFSTLDSSRPDIEGKLSRLPEQARAVVILHEYLGYQHNEIASLMGIAIGTSKSHLFRARNFLREHPQ